jgi:molybdopterin-guanine dinucleotide biosynthesis protein A
VAFAAGLELLEDEDKDAGPIAGIASALRYTRAEGWDAVLTLPCDTPLLPANLLERLSLAIETPALAAIAQSGGRLHPSCAIWSVSAGAVLPAYLSERRSLLGFAERLNATQVDWSVEPYDPFFNVNTAYDLAAAERLLKSR